MSKRFNIHDWQAKINEQGFDDRLANAMGMSNDEFEDEFSVEIINHLLDNTAAAAAAKVYFAKKGI